jgi:hypothetical protein
MAKTKTQQRWRPGDIWRSPVVATTKSGNKKTGPVATTSISQASCPTDCKFLRAGCYAETVGMQPFTTRRLNSAAETRPDVIARLEAAAIDRLPGDRKLRVHVVGDSRTRRAASITGSAMRRYERRSGRVAWTYTHAWSLVPVTWWRGARVMASTHSATEIKKARARGYASVISVPDRHPTRKAYRVGTETVVPCPAQFSNSGVTCETCNLCMQPDVMLARGLTVAFQPDGLPKR